MSGGSAVGLPEADDDVRAILTGLFQAWQVDVDVACPRAGEFRLTPSCGSRLLLRRGSASGWYLFRARGGADDPEQLLDECPGVTVALRRLREILVPDRVAARMVVAPRAKAAAWDAGQ